jgi:PAS domain S-box-containing protein
VLRGRTISGEGGANAVAGPDTRAVRCVAALAGLRDVRVVVVGDESKAGPAEDELTLAARAARQGEVLCHAAPNGPSDATTTLALPLDRAHVVIAKCTGDVPAATRTALDELLTLLRGAPDPSADISEQRRERLLARVGEAVAGAHSVQELLADVARGIRSVTGWAWAEVWIDPNGRGELRCSSVLADDRVHATSLVSATLGRVLEPGAGVVEAAASGARPVSITDLAQLGPRRGPAEEAGLAFGEFLPVVVQDRMLAVLGFLHDDAEGWAAWAPVLADAANTITRSAARHASWLESERVFALSADAMLVATTDGRVLRVNQAFLQILGWREEELLGRSLVDLVHPDDRPRTRREAARLADGAPSPTFENRYATRDGGWRWLSWSSRLVPGEGVFYAVVRDVTERRRLQALAAGQRDVLEIIARGASLNAVLDRVARVLDDHCASARAAILLFGSAARGPELGAAPGVPAALAAQLPVLPISTLPPGLLQLADIDAPALSAAAAAAGVQAFSWHPIVSQYDRPLGAIVLCHPTPRGPSSTEQPILETGARLASIAIERSMEGEALREQAALLDQTNDAIVVVDLDGRVSYCNQAASRLFELERGGGPGSLFASLAGRDPGPHLAVLEVVHRDGTWTGEVTHRRRDGRELSLDARWSVVRDESGQPRAFMASFTDVTLRKGLEAQYLRAQRLESIGTLAGGIAHDLNNILTPILLSIAILRQDVPASTLDTLGTIEEAATRGAGMVRQVLTFARGGGDGQRNPLDPAALVRDVTRIASDSFLRTIEVVTVLPESLPAINGDETQLHQVLLNLAVNARDAMPHGGTLTIGAELVVLDASYAAMRKEARPGPYVVLSVTDTGTGIPPEIRDRVFEPFFTTKAPGDGTGLGLANVASLVRAHEGFVDLHSEVGRGTTFKIYVPAVEGPTAETTLELELPRGAGELVLVVDDEPCVASVTRTTLEANGYRVLVASDGAEATALYAARPREISAVLTDVMMPIMDGVATSRAILCINPEARIIAASGLASPGTIDKLARLGINNFLAKPYTATTLLRELRRVLHPA